MADVQSELWELILYPDSTTYAIDDVLTRVRDTFDYWCYITHDRDLTSDGEPKKTHMHVMCKRSGAMRLTTVQNAFPELSDACIQRGKRWRSMVRYETHADETDPLKHHYGVNEITSNFNHNQYFLDNRREAGLIAIGNYIIQSHCKDFRSLYKFGVEHDCISEVIRGGSFWSRMMEETK